MAAAGGEQAGLAGGDDGGAKVQTGDGAAGAFDEAVRHAADEDGAVEFVLEAAGDDADNAGVPFFAVDEDDGVAGLDLGFGGVRGGLQRAGFDGLALAVDGVQAFGEQAGVQRIVGEQEAEAEIGFADAAAGIDARAEGEAAGHGGGGFAGVGDVQESGEAGSGAAGHDAKALRHEGAV